MYGGAYGYAGGADVVSLAILAGHTGNYGLTESTMPATNWGQGLGFGMGCVNAAAYKGVTFWVRGVVPSGPVVATGDDITGFTLLMALNYAGSEDAGYAPVPGDISFAIDDIAFMP